jgi:hypothetical protein
LREIMAALVQDESWQDFQPGALFEVAWRALQNHQRNIHIE